jgi:hypothetical protein
MGRSGMFFGIKHWRLRTIMEYVKQFRFRKAYPEGASKEIVEASGFGRNVQPSTGADTNPLFSGQQPDSVRLGTRRMVAKVLIRQKNPQWAFCRTHSVVVYRDKDGTWRDWVQDKHNDALDPLNRCHITAISPEQIAQLDEKLAEMLGGLTQVAATLVENITEAKEAKRRKHAEGRSSTFVNITE